MLRCEGRGHCASAAPVFPTLRGIKIELEAERSGSGAARAKVIGFSSQAFEAAPCPSVGVHRSSSSTILATVYNDLMNTCVASKPELARDNDFQNLIATTLLDLSHAGQIEPRELTRIALARASNYVRTKQRK